MQVTTATGGKVPMKSDIHEVLSHTQPLTVSTTVDFIEENQTVSCVHFWQIASPNGPLSRGTCKLCGDTKEFRNSLYNPIVPTTSP
jgi:hypothetical protein